MNYMSWIYYLMVLVLLIVYYILPKRIRWFVLLVGSMYFYSEIIDSKKQIVVFLFSIVISYLAAIILQKIKKTECIIVKRLVLFLGILLSVMPLLLEKIGSFLGESVVNMSNVSWIIPIGLSFYSLQIVAYLVDVYKGEVKAQINFLKYVLFISFFPQIIQGPIPRFNQLDRELFDGNEYDFDNIMRGIQLVIWAFFLKYMIADKAAVIVDAVFDNYQAYSGVYIWVAAILYSFQLYTDFLSCTTISQGVAQMFGIKLVNNFNHPYFSTSIKEFWRRWHMSLSSWLRDYVYIPLGGNRRGKFFKWSNLLVTFVVSGVWHGGRLHFIIWGALHAFYQIIGEIIHDVVDKFGFEKYRMKSEKLANILMRIGTFILVMIAWIIFRADTLHVAIEMIKAMIVGFNPWVLFDDSLFELGLNWKEFIVLFISLGVLGVVSMVQESGVKIRDWFSRQNTVTRWIIYLVAIWTIWIFGSYGYGFDTKDFIYGGF